MDPALSPAEPSSPAAFNAQLGEALGRYARSEPGAFGAVYALLSGRLYGFCLRLCRRREDADDLLQETFVKLHRVRESYAPGATGLAWIYAIARSTHLDRLRRQKRRPESVGETDDVATTYPGTTSLFAGAAALGASPETAAATSQMMKAIRAILSNLPETQRDAFVLIKEEGLSIAEAAAVLGTTEMAVKLRAHRAYEAIRERLGADGTAR